MFILIATSFSAYRDSKKKNQVVYLKNERNYIPNLTVVESKKYFFLKPNNYVFSWKIVWSPIHMTFQIVVMPHGSLWLNIIVI